MLETGTGGHFNGRNPNVTIQTLIDKWVPDIIVLYIGKAGSDNGSATLKSRLKQYFDFGRGPNIGHWGGRYVWQFAKSSELLVCWKPTPNADPRDVEKELIRRFAIEYGARPFANLTD